MGGSRSYSVSSNDSSTSSGGSSSTSGNYSDYSAAGSVKLCKLTSTAPKLVYSRTENQRGSGGGAETMVSLQQQQLLHQRARPKRVMCRCCLSEQQQSTTRVSQESGSDEEASSLLEFVSLDTLAMVDLRNDKFTTSPTAGSGSDSCKATPASSAAGIRVSTTTLLDCLNACAHIGASLADIELPQHICQDCCHTLEMCSEFIRCVRNADKILRRRCALPSKRSRQLQLEQQPQLSQQRQAAAMPAVGSDVWFEEGPTVKRRRRREEKLQQEHHLNVGRAGAGASAKSLGYITPKSISLPKSVTATVAVTSTERDELLDIGIALDGVESSFVRSFDSGIEIDEDLSSVKSSDCSANENPIRYHLARYEGYTYVVAETLSHDLERFHRSGRKQVGGGGGGGAAAAPATPATYKCGFCIFECSVRQELNKHLQIHLGPPQHSCRKCNFVGHFKFLLALHMRNVHHCVMEALGAGQEACQTNTGRRGGDIARGYQSVGAVAESLKYHCHLCGDCFVNYDALQQHRKSHKVFCKCTMCAFKSSTRENVLEHMAKEHKVLVERRLIVKYIPLQRINVEHLQESAATKNTSESTESSLLPKDNKYRKHLCQFCGKCFDRRFHLLKHEYGVHRLEIEQTNSVDATIRGKLFGYGVGGGTSTKHTKLKYLRQRNAVQAARQQRCIEELALLDDQQPGQDITSKFQCEICSAVFMFNFELKYHMRTHKISTHTQTTGDKRTGTPTSPLSAAATAKCKQQLSAVITTERSEQAAECQTNCEGDDAGEYVGDNEGEGEVDGGDEGDGEDEGNGGDDAEGASLKYANGLSNSMDATLSGLGGGVDLDLMALVAPQMSPLDSLDASPTSSNNSFDINYDDQLYLNDFDLGLLDCNGGFGGF